MENKTISLAIHQQAKADMMKQLLEENGITVFLKEIQTDIPSFSININEEDVSKALKIIENRQLFDYSEKGNIKIDDGRKRILVPVDFSDDSLKACRFAFSVAKAIKAKVKIFHVFDKIYYPIQMPFVGMVDKGEEEDLLKISRKKILELCNNIDKEISEGALPSINFSYALREGVVRDEIESFIEEYNPSLIIIGTRGVGAKTMPSSGSSVASDIIETTNIPVIAIPYSSDIANIKNVKHLVYLVNTLDRKLRFNDLEYFLNLGSSFKITVVHLNIQGKSGLWTEMDIQVQKETLQQAHPQIDIDFQIIESTNIIEGLNDTLKAMKIDMVVLNTKRRNFWGIVFKPSISRKIISNINTAIMVLRG